MNTKDMLKQIDVTLAQEESYLAKYDNQLSNPDIKGEAREKIIMLREAVFDAISRHKMLRVKYV